MTDQMQLSIIQTFIDNSKDANQKSILENIYTELTYRLPESRINPGSLCPRCHKFVDSKDTFCSSCGQYLE